MKCPECGKQLSIPYNSERNMESYMNPCTTITNCCGKLIRCMPRFSFTAYKYEGEATEDDWGRKPK